jgi:hypothetical protein
VSEPRYPRDLRGYGRNPPHPHWPGNARIAVQFVVNFEEGGENNILHGDRASEAFLSDVLGAQPWPGQRHANIESMFEYGSRAGFGVCGGCSTNGSGRPPCLVSPPH